MIGCEKLRNSVLCAGDIVPYDSEGEGGKEGATAAIPCNAIPAQQGLFCSAVAKDGFSKWQF